MTSLLACSLPRKIFKLSFSSSQNSRILVTRFGASRVMRTMQYGWQHNTSSPNCVVQICHVHFLENIRRQLRVRTYENYVSFFAEMRQYIFDVPILGKDRLEARIRGRSPRHQDDPLKIAVMQHIFQSSEKLTAYVHAKAHLHVDCPKTTNLIESMNKQLNGRLKTIQGFESFKTAARWLFAWILRKRLTPFTCCRGRFRKLNGTSSIKLTRRGRTKIPNFFTL